MHATDESGVEASTPEASTSEVPPASTSALPHPQDSPHPLAQTGPLAETTTRETATRGEATTAETRAAGDERESRAQQARAQQQPPGEPRMRPEPDKDALVVLVQQVELESDDVSQVTAPPPATLQTQSAQHEGDVHVVTEESEDAVGSTGSEVLEAAEASVIPVGEGSLRELGTHTQDLPVQAHANAHAQTLHPQDLHAHAHAHAEVAHADETEPL